MKEQSIKALYNKYRPVGLGSVRGQEHVKRVLINQVKAGEVAHAYIFSGPAGTGKTTCARILASMVNCSTGQTLTPSPDDKFVSIILTGQCMVDVLEIDAASNNGIDNIRELRQKAYYSPIEMSKKVYIIDECHRLTPQAWDGLLKIIEEPPDHVIFILCTTEQEKIPDTIKTRCMMLDFKALSAADVSAEVMRISEAEGISFADDATRMLVGGARGSLRQAISWLEALRVAADGKAVTPEMVMKLAGTAPRARARDFVMAALAGGRAIDALIASSSVLSGGGRPDAFLAAVANFCHDVMMHGTKGYDWAALGYSEEDVEDLVKAKSVLENRCAATGVKPPVDPRRLMLKWIKKLQHFYDFSVLNINPQFQVNAAYTEMYFVLKKMLEKPTH